MQGKEREELLVHTTLDTRDNSVSCGDHQHLHWFESLPQENLKKHSTLDYPVHIGSHFHWISLPLPRQTGIYEKARSDYRK